MFPIAILHMLLMRRSFFYDTIKGLDQLIVSIRETRHVRRNDITRFTPFTIGKHSVLSAMH